MIDCSAPGRTPLPAGPLELPPLDGRLHAMHYSCALPEDAAGGTQQVSAAVIGNMLTGRKKAFAACLLAELRRIPPANLHAHLGELEAELLRQLFAHIAAHPDAVWLWWSTHNPRFGFDALAHRARLHGIEPVEVPEAQVFDLDNFFKGRFGPKYAEDPRLLTMIRLNGLAGDRLLDKGGAAEAWRRGDYGALLDSLSAKVNAITGLYQKARLGELRVGRDEAAGRGDGPEGALRRTASPGGAQGGGRWDGAGRGETGQGPHTPAHEFLPATGLARRFDVPYHPLRKRLERWRGQHRDSYTENGDPRTREPRYLYRVEDVRPVIERLKESIERPSAV